MEDPIDSYSFDCRLIAPNIGVNKGFSLGRVPQIVGAGYHVIGFTHDAEFFNPYHRMYAANSVRFEHMCVCVCVNMSVASHHMYNVQFVVHN